MSSPAPATAPSPLGPALARARAWAVALPRPARVLIATTLVAALALGGYLAYRAANVPYEALYSQLDRDDAAAVVAKLRELHVPYRLRSEGATIDVPAERVHELRLELASAGLPRGGGVGFESFDRMRLGATEFEQQVLFRRALEGELARSVSTLRAVESARVHLVLPERTVFVSRSEPATASVVVRLRPGRRLGGAEVSGIVHLLASSVPGLAAEKVTLVTTEGLMLHRPRGEGEAAGDDPQNRAGEARALETSLEDRVRALLERVVGPGHADVRASVELDLARVERTEDRYDPDGGALRSEERTTERAGGASTPPTVAGVPGAESNLPGGAAPGAQTTPGAGNNLVRESQTRNFEVGHVIERRVSTGGAVRRVTVAVVVDGVERTAGGRTTVVPREREEIDRLEALVRGAVGYDARRGDVVTVASVPFAGRAAAAPAGAAQPRARPAARPPRWRRYVPAAGAAAALLVVAGVAGVIGLRRRASRRAAEAAEAAWPPGTQGLLRESGAEPIPETFEALRDVALARAASDPASAALVLRFWLGGDEPPA